LTAPSKNLRLALALGAAAVALWLAYVIFELMVRGT
jgi:hypothetical protein